MRGIIFVVAFSGLAGGCTTWSSLNFLTPYKIDIQQGNVVEQKDVSKLKPGMLKAEVKTILGTPLLADPFHADRWDYIYWYRKGGVVTEERRFTVFFDQGKLARVEGGVAPPAQEIDKSVTK
ncbi:MAG: outer membrane protein assembly factor BamE [Pseudomonadota bacterium]